MKIEVLGSLDELSLTAARLFSKKLREKRDSPFTVALSGGSTPRSLYKHLSTEPLASEIPWSNLQVFFSDERCVPRGSSESNYQMTYEHLLSQVPIPDANIHPIPTDDMDSQGSAHSYEQEIREFFSCADLSSIPSFDLIFLGLGADGHTLSLFPESEALKDCQRSDASSLVLPSVAGDSAGVSTRERITMTPALVNNAKSVVFMVSGVDKARAVRDTLGAGYKGNGDKTQLRYPARMIAPSSGELIWLLDKEAASLLDP